MLLRFWGLVVVGMFLLGDRFVGGLDVVRGFGKLIVVVVFGGIRSGFGELV